MAWNETIYSRLLAHVHSASQRALSTSNTSSVQLEEEDVDNFTGWGRPTLFKKSPPLVALFTLAYVVIFLLAVVNNCLVVTAIVRNTQLRTVTNYFLANLAIADIMVSFIVLPLTLLNNLFSEWLFGAFLCKTVPYLQAVAVGASVNTLAAVAIERYIAIFYPQSTILRHRNALIVICVIWLVPVFIQIPWAVYYHLETFEMPEIFQLTTLCYPRGFKKGFFLGVVFLTCYLIPLMVIWVFYSLIGVRVWRRSVAGIKGSKTERNINRSKIRIVRMLIVVAVVFAFCWLPLYATRLYILFGPKMADSTKKLTDEIIFPLAQWLGSATSCVNPFIYCFFSEQFRKSIVSLIQCKPVLNTRASLNQR